MLHALASSSGWNHLVHQADLHRFPRWQIVAEEHELLGPLEPDAPGQEIGASGVDQDATPDEDLREIGVLRRDDEIARERDLRSHPRGGTLYGGDDGLAAIEDGVDEALGAFRAMASWRETSPGRRGFSVPPAPLRRSAPVQKCFPFAASTTPRTHNHPVAACSSPRMTGR